MKVGSLNEGLVERRFFEGIVEIDGGFVEGLVERDFVEGLVDVVVGMLDEGNDLLVEERMRRGYTYTGD